MNDTILQEIMTAYADAHGDVDNELAMQRRKLDFLASGPVSRDDAVAIMAKAVDHSYNNFTAALLAKLPADAQITLAREGSVCVYVAGKVKPVKSMLADEWDYDAAKNRTRLWWD